MPQLKAVCIPTKETPAKDTPLSLCLLFVYIYFFSEKEAERERLRKGESAHLWFHSINAYKHRGRAVLKSGAGKSLSPL